MGENNLAKLQHLEAFIESHESLLTQVDNADLDTTRFPYVKNLARYTQYTRKDSVLNSSYKQSFIELMDSIPSVSVQGYNSQREVIYWNKASEIIYGYTAKEAIGRKIEELIIPDVMVKDTICAIDNWINGGAMIPAGELVLTGKGNREVHVFSSHIMLGAKTASPEMFCVDIDLNEIKSLRSLNEDLQDQVNQDRLTGIFNRAYMETVINQQLTASVRQNKPASLIMFDVDKFKRINDEYGHDAGDKALIKLTQIVSDIIRQEDTFARWGGEEFMLMVNSSIHSAYLIADKLRMAIEVETQQLAGIPAFTCSFGVVNINEYQNLSDAYKAVDEKLYTAKNNGRNRVE